MTQFDRALKMLAKAEDALHNAEHDLNGGFALATANRAYYAIFYCMIALLNTKQVYAKTHSGTHAKFAELFIKTGEFPISASDDIALLFKNRQQADYDFDTDLTDEAAKTLISKTTQFLQLTKQYFDQLNADSGSDPK
jgi:uncharacterized protein (UPF0332 family)